MKRDALIAAMQETANPAPRKVTVDGWGDLWVKAQTVHDVQEQTDADAAAGVTDEKRRMARACARVIYDEDGERVFDPANPADLDLLDAQPWSKLQGVLAVANGGQPPN